MFSFQENVVAAATVTIAILLAYLWKDYYDWMCLSVKHPMCLSVKHPSVSSVGI